MALVDWLPSLSQHFLISVAALLIYVVNARARRERRSPSAAIGWVMGLGLMPYVVLPLYLLFGQRKLRASQVAARPRSTVQGRWPSALLDSLNVPPPAPAHVVFHANGEESRRALWDLINNARSSLDICTFLIGDDAFGIEALERLASKARSGVRVRLLYDGLWSWTAPSAALRSLRSAGAQTRVFRPLLSLRRAGVRNLRNHRKLAIADRIAVWAGGRNLASEYFTGDATKAAWLDLSYVVGGRVATDAAFQFEHDWENAFAAIPDAQPTESPAAEELQGGPAQFLPSGPDQTEDTAQQLLIDACFRARQRILAVTPYFVPDSALQGALRLAARRGVEVTIVIPATSNHRLADFVRNRPLRELTTAGAQIHLLPVMSHAKAVVIDDRLAMCGSINLDCRSLLLNYECAVLFYGAAEIQWLSSWILARKAECSTFDATPPGLVRDLTEGALLAVAFQV
jgi:cardiolipin synthase A/B